MFYTMFSFSINLSDSPLSSFNKYLYFNKKSNNNNSNSKDRGVSLDVSIDAEDSFHLNQCDPIKCFLNKTRF